MSLIFAFSAQGASEFNKLSTGFAIIIEEFLKTAESFILKFTDLSINFNVDNINHFLRKSAHFLVYALLGMLVIRATQVSGFKDKKWTFIAFMICLLYAVLDEDTSALCAWQKRRTSRYLN